MNLSFPFLLLLSSLLLLPHASLSLLLIITLILQFHFFLIRLPSPSFSYFFLFFSIISSNTTNKNESWDFFLKSTANLCYHQTLFEGSFHKATFRGNFLGDRGLSISAVESRIWGLKGGIAGKSVCTKLLLSWPYKSHPGVCLFGPLKLLQQEARTIWFHPVHWVVSNFARLLSFF